jgi:hypothetical protein
MPLEFENMNTYNPMKGPIGIAEVVDTAMGTASLLERGALECLRAEHQRLVEIVKCIVVALPDDKQIELAYRMGFTVAPTD